MLHNKAQQSPIIPRDVCSVVYTPRAINRLEIFIIQPRFVTLKKKRIYLEEDEEAI
jgi:hypothetical protein